MPHRPPRHPALIVAVLLLGILGLARALRADDAPSVKTADDFDAFWAARLTEFRAFPLRATVKPWKQEGEVALSVVYYDSVKDVRIHGYLAVPAGEGRHPGLVLIPGLGDRGHWEWALEGARAGFTTLCCDLRGQGKSKGAPPDVLAMYRFGRPEDHFFTGCVADVLRGVDLLAARGEVDPDWLFVEGFSLGGGLSIAVAALEPRIKAAAIGAPAFCDFEREARESQDPRMVLLRGYLATLSDPEEGRRALRAVDNSNFTARLKIPVLFGMSRRDPVIEYAGVRRAYDLIPSQDKEFIVNDVPRHAPPPDFLERAAALCKRVMAGQK